MIAAITTSLPNILEFNPFTSDPLLPSSDLGSISAEPNPLDKNSNKKDRGNGCQDQGRLQVIRFLLLLHCVMRACARNSFSLLHGRRYFKCMERRRARHSPFQ